MNSERQATLLEKCRLRLRKAGRNDLDSDIEQLILAAAEDLKRFGVNAGAVDEDGSPLIDEAIIIFVQANYGGNPAREELMLCYMAHCQRLALSGHNNG